MDKPCDECSAPWLSGPTADECGAPEFFSNGSKLLLAKTTDGKLTQVEGRIS